MERKNKVAETGNAQVKYLKIVLNKQFLCKWYVYSITGCFKFWPKDFLFQSPWFLLVSISPEKNRRRSRWVFGIFARQITSKRFTDHCHVVDLFFHWSFPHYKTGHQSNIEQLHHKVQTAECEDCKPSRCLCWERWIEIRSPRAGLTNLLRKNTGRNCSEMRRYSGLQTITEA